MQPNKVLCVGLTCLDIVYDCEKYPQEDDIVSSTQTSHNRCLSTRWQRGGNASNSSTVLSLLGSNTTLMSAVANSDEKEFLLSDMTKYSIDSSHLVFYDNYKTPSSVVICSEETGSRTIIHYSDNLPEVSLADFQKLPLATFNWIHFEGRNVDTVLQMMKLTREECPNVTVSVELEKIRPGIEALMSQADVVFASKEYSKYLGFNDMKSAAKGIAERAGERCHTVIIPWGEEGATAYHCPTLQLIASPAYPPKQVMDTLGAGDTFLGCTIHALSNNKSLSSAIEFGCRVAGKKVGLKGWQCLQQQLALGDIQL